MSFARSVSPGLLQNEKTRSAKIKRGDKVVFPFGRGNNDKEGFVLELLTLDELKEKKFYKEDRYFKSKDAIDNLKSIKGLAKGKIAASDILLKIAIFICKEYAAPISLCVNAVLPVKKEIRKNTRQRDIIDNYVVADQIIDFNGNVIGAVMPGGDVIATNNLKMGHVLQDGKVVNQNGQLVGEVVRADIVISNDDKVVGFVAFDGTVRSPDNQRTGRMLSDGLVVDNQNNIIGYAFKIGTAVLSSEGKYLGYVNENGRVISPKGEDIGYLRSNGSMIDKDKKISGYALHEVAQNRRN